MPRPQKKTRASQAGEATAEALIEMINLMYQNNTALKFLRALIDNLKREYKIRTVKKRR